MRKIYIKNKERRETVRLEMLVHGPYNLCAEARTERVKASQAVSD